MVSRLNLGKISGPVSKGDGGSKIQRHGSAGAGLGLATTNSDRSGKIIVTGVSSVVGFPLTR
jgi:hypothetical protein